MYLRLGNTTIADSNTDAVTRTLSAPTPELSLSPESLRITGAKWSRQISRCGAAFTIDITIGRQFGNYLLAERFAHKHAPTLNGIASGILKFQTMLGDVFAYDNAALSRVVVARDSGVWVEMQYSFVCGAPFSTFAATVGGTAVTLSGNKITLNA